MFQKSAAIIIVLLATTLFATSNTFAQGNPGSGPCLLGVGNNCPQGGGNQPGSVDTGRGTRYYDGQIAQEIINAHNYGSRYLLVLNRYWDYDQKCFVEERAWVSQIRANGGGQVAVVIGPSVKVYIRSNTMTAQQVNQAEGYLQYSRNEMYKWLKYQEQLAQYLNNPSYKQWATQEYQRADAWINYYKQYVANTQAAVATSAP